MAQLPKSLVISFNYISDEVSRLMHDAQRNPMTRQEWDKINVLLELFSDDIKAMDSFQKAIDEEEADNNGNT